MERPGNGFGKRPLRQLPDRIPTPRDPARRYVFVTDRAVQGPVERPGNGFGKRPLRQLPDRIPTPRDPARRYVFVTDRAV